MTIESDRLLIARITAWIGPGLAAVLGRAASGSDWVFLGGAAGIALGTAVINHISGRRGPGPLPGMAGRRVA